MSSKSDQNVMEAAADGDADALRLLLKVGGNPNARDEDGDTPLHAASTPETVYELARAGADMSAANDRQETALHTAAAEGDERVVAALLIAGADPHAADWAGCTPLHLAETPPVVQHIAAAGATPLYWAAWNGRKAVVEALCRCGADVHQPNAEGVTPMTATIRACHPKISKVLTQFGAKKDED